MNFLNSAARSGGGTPVTGATKGGGFTELTMYRERPSGEISLEEFEKYALDRLRVLKAIEEAKLRSKPDDAIQADVAGLLKRHLQCSSRQETQRKDLVSHHILRLAYCRTAELRSWLLQHESLLFKYRFRALSREQQVEFFGSMDLPYRAITDAELSSLAHDLAAVYLAAGDRAARDRLLAGAGAAAGGGGGGSKGGDTMPVQDTSSRAAPRPQFYRVPFQAVPDLVGSRRVLLRGGQAYVGEDQVYALVVGSFRSWLSASLAEAARAWGEFTAAEADRLAPLVDSLPSRSLNGGSGAARAPPGEITAGQLPQLVAGRHFPLCMSVMYERLSSEHHLKHWGLQQLSLFLKAIGLPLEQALLFFRQQFSPRTPGDKFGREYAYNLRYNYGQEGKRQEWSEWSCVRIINQEVGGASTAPCECNGGCPYKTFDAAQLRGALARLSCSEQVIREVVDKARGKHYQLACGLAFEGITGAPQDTGINRPSEYYAASVELATQRAAAAEAAGASGQQQQQQLGGAGGGGGGPPSTPLPAAADGGQRGAPGAFRGAAAAAASTPTPMKA